MGVVLVLDQLDTNEARGGGPANDKGRGVDSLLVFKRVFLGKRVERRARKEGPGERLDQSLGMSGDEPESNEWRDHERLGVLENWKQRFRERNKYPSGKGLK
ncbi:hypothetical protein TNCV_1109361 [Trichonephila clavipes]|nr:hypothetical protein TNCV_1109361 [Trichonephila clavipes]